MWKLNVGLKIKITKMELSGKVISVTENTGVKQDGVTEWFRYDVLINYEQEQERKRERKRNKQQHNNKQKRNRNKRKNKQKRNPKQTKNLNKHKRNVNVSKIINEFICIFFLHPPQRLSCTFYIFTPIFYIRCCFFYTWRGLFF